MSTTLGTGFDLPLTAVYTKRRTVRETYQSDYYILGDGGEFPLYRKKKEKDYVEFLSAEHPFWKFRMFESCWEVVKDDGSVWTYGGTWDSQEMHVYWGNFGGPCQDSDGKEVPVGWYLSRVVNRYGD